MAIIKSVMLTNFEGPRLRDCDLETLKLREIAIFVSKIY